MKSNIGKGSKLPKVRAKENEDKNSLISATKKVELIPVIKRLVQKDYEEAVESLGEDRTLEILEHMLTRKYMNKFQPNTLEIRSIVKRCVARLIEKEAEENLAETLDVGNIENKSKSELEVKLNELKLIKKSIGSKVKSGIDALIELYENTLKERENEITIENVVTPNVESHHTIEETPMQSEESKTINFSEKAEEVMFYETVKGFTHNFKFLTESSFLHYSMVGGKISKKFDNYEQYERFNNLRNILRMQMKTFKLSEKQAIAVALERMEDKLKVADRKILLDRQATIEKEISKQER